MLNLFLVTATLLPISGDADADPVITSGPVVGRVTTDEIRVWCRVDRQGRSVEGVLFDSSGTEVSRVLRSARTDSDFTIELLFDSGVKPGQSYRYGVLVDGDPVAVEADQIIETPPAGAGEARLIFGSCASKSLLKTTEIWKPIAERSPHQLIFLGDTPYIDSTDLEKQRSAYREFWRSPGLSDLVRRVPVAATWDDHDYGRDDTLGELEGRDRSRKAFSEYHAMGEIGDGEGGGVYSKLSWGPVEVFLVDTRWYGDTEPSPVDPGQPTLLGSAQWEWLKMSLRESRALFKIVASGMIFNGSVRPGKKDHWMQYPHERFGLLHFIGEERIPGVLIVTGDIHRCRHLSYPSTAGAGYSIDEWITSPLANNVIETANVDHPALVFDAGERGVFLSVEAQDTGVDPGLWCRLITAEGKVLHEKFYTPASLSPEEWGSGAEKH
jgi:alkaline phosphatase D